MESARELLGLKRKESARALLSLPPADLTGSSTPAIMASGASPLYPPEQVRSSTGVADTYIPPPPVPYDKSMTLIGDRPVTPTEKWQSAGMGALAQVLSPVLGDPNELGGDKYRDPGLLGKFYEARQNAPLEYGAGQYAGDLVPFAASAKIGQKILPKAVQTFSPLAQKILQGTATGAAYGTGQVAGRVMNDQPANLEQIPLDAALFGGGDAVLHGGGRLLKSIGEPAARSVERAAVEPVAERAVAPVAKEAAGGKVPWDQVKTYKGSDGGSYADYALGGKRNDGFLTVELDKKRGYRVRNVFVNENLKRQGNASTIYEQLNAESISKTGKPLRSSEVGYGKKSGSTTMSPDAEALWDSFVAKGKAKKVGEHYEFTLTPEPRNAATSAKMPIETPKVEPVVPNPPEGKAKQLDLGVVEPKATVEPSVKSKSELTGLSKTEIERIRDRMDLERLSPPEKRGWAKAYSEAKSLGHDANALELADEVTRTKRQITDSELAGMILKKAELETSYDTAVQEMARQVDVGDNAAYEVARNRRDAILGQIDKLTEGATYGKRESARALSLAGSGIDRKDMMTIGRLVTEAKAIKGKPLTSEEVTAFDNIVAQYKNVERELQDALSKEQTARIDSERRLAEAIAQREIKKARIRASSTKSKAYIDTEITDIKKQLSALGYRANDIVGASSEALYLVGKLAVAYARKGAGNLSEIAKLVMADFPELTERDIYRGLNTKDPTRKAKLISESEKRINKLKTQARLTVAFEDAQKGIFEAPRKTPPQPQEIKQLQIALRKLRASVYDSGTPRLERAVRTINELQDQLSNAYRTMKKAKKPIGSALATAKQKISDLRKQMSAEDRLAILQDQRVNPSPVARKAPVALSPELASIKQKISDLRKHLAVEGDIASLQDQIRTGDFKVKPVETQKAINPDVERLQIQKKRLQRQVRKMQDALSPMTGRKAFREGVNFMRTAKTIFDISATMRQGLVLSVTSPRQAMKAQGKALRSMFSEYADDQIDGQISRDANKFLMDRAGLSLTEKETTLGQREEFFSSNLIEKIPLYKEVVKGSERHMRTFLNLMRVAKFNEFLDLYPNATDTEMKAVANWINVATGRGDLGKAAAVANELSLAVFAPRFAVSRVQTPYMMFKHWKEPRVRKVIAQDLAGTLAFGSSMLTLGALAGFESSNDPDSPDFGKMRIGDTRIDFWAGFQQPIRTTAEIVKLGTNRLGLTESQRESSPLELLGRFAAFKVSPAVSIGTEILTGKDIVGHDVGVTGAMADAVVPLLFQDVYDAYKRGGVPMGVLAGTASALGAGASSYKDSKTTALEKVKQLIRDGNFQEAQKVINRWNSDAPLEKDKRLPGIPQIRQNMAEAYRKQQVELVRSANKQGGQ